MFLLFLDDRFYLGLSSAISLGQFLKQKISKKAAMNSRKITFSWRIMTFAGSTGVLGLRRASGGEREGSLRRTSKELVLIFVIFFKSRVTVGKAICDEEGHVEAIFNLLQVVALVTIRIGNEPPVGLCGLINSLIISNSPGCARLFFMQCPSALSHYNAVINHFQT